MITRVEYHSPHWAELVEQQWVTMYVEPGNVAVMLKQDAQ